MKTKKTLILVALFVWCVFFGTESQAAIRVWAGADHTRQDGSQYHEGLGGGDADADSIEGFIDAIQVAKGVVDLARAIAAENPLDAGIAIRDIINESGQLNDSLGNRSFSYEGSIVVDIRNDRRVELKIEGESDQDDFHWVHFHVPDGPVGAFQESYVEIFSNGNKDVTRSLYIDPSKLKAGMHYPVVAITKEDADITNLSVVWMIDVVAGAQCPRPPSDSIHMCFQTTSHLKDLRSARQENRLVRARAIAHDPSLAYTLRANQAANACGRAGNCRLALDLGPDQRENACPQIYTGLARSTCNKIAQLDGDLINIYQQIMNWEKQARESDCCDAFVNPFGDNVSSRPLTVATNATYKVEHYTGPDHAPDTVSQTQLLSSLFGATSLNLSKNPSGTYAVNGQPYESVSIHTNIVDPDDRDLLVTTRWSDAGAGLPVPEVRTGMNGQYGKEAYVNVGIRPEQFPIGQHLLIIEVTDRGNQIAQHSIEITRTVQMTGDKIPTTAAQDADGGRPIPPALKGPDLPVFNAIVLKPNLDKSPENPKVRAAPPEVNGGFIANISGQWNSNIGLVYEINQRGTKFTWNVANIGQSATGTIDGDMISATWKDRKGIGSAKGIIREKDSNGGVHRIEWDNGVVFTK